MATAVPGFNPPSSSSGTITVGTTVVSGGTDLRYLYQNAGLVQSGNLRNGTSGALSAASVGTSNPVDWSVNVEAGTHAPFQIHAATASAIVGYGVYNSAAGDHGGGLLMSGTSAPIGRVYSFGNASGNFLGVSKSTKTILDSSGGGIGIGTRTAHEVRIGANDVTHLVFDGSATSVGMTASKPITHAVTTLTGAAIATTGTIGIPQYYFTAPGANRTFTLPALSTLPDGYTMEFVVVGSIGGFAITLDGNASETIDGAVTNNTLLAADRASCAIRRVSSTEWQSVYP
jgi:hypothetical protein